MKVKIGDQIYDSNEQPIMLILGEEDKEAIAAMGKQTKYCSYPDRPEFTKNNYAKIMEFMKTD